MNINTNVNICVCSAQNIEAVYLPADSISIHQRIYVHTSVLLYYELIKLSSRCLFVTVRSISDFLYRRDETSLSTTFIMTNVSVFIYCSHCEEKTNQAPPPRLDKPLLPTINLVHEDAIVNAIVSVIDAFLHNRKRPRHTRTLSLEAHHELFFAIHHTTFVRSRCRNSSNSGGHRKQQEQRNLKRRTLMELLLYHNTMWYISFIN